MPNEKPLLQTDRFRVVGATYQTARGQTVHKAVIRHPGSVVIVPIDAREQVHLIRNYRVAAGQPLIELPAGTLEPGEQHLAAARRELAEETGLRAGRLEPLTSFYAAPGILDEHMHLFLATQLEPGPPAREEGEEIENLTVPLATALDWIRDGEIRDAKTIIGLMFYQRWGQP